METTCSLPWNRDLIPWLEDYYDTKYVSEKQRNAYHLFIDLFRSSTDPKIVKTVNICEMWKTLDPELKTFIHSLSVKGKKGEKKLKPQDVSEPESTDLFRNTLLERSVVGVPCTSSSLPLGDEEKSIHDHTSFEDTNEKEKENEKERRNIENIPNIPNITNITNIQNMQNIQNIENMSRWKYDILCVHPFRCLWNQKWMHWSVPIPISEIRPSSKVVQSPCIVLTNSKKKRTTTDDLENQSRRGNNGDYKNYKDYKDYKGHPNPLEKKDLDEKEAGAGGMESDDEDQRKTFQKYALVDDDEDSDDDSLSSLTSLSHKKPLTEEEEEERRERNRVGRNRGTLHGLQDVEGEEDREGTDPLLDAMTGLDGHGEVVEDSESENDDLSEDDDEEDEDDNDDFYDDDMSLLLE